MPPFPSSPRPGVANCFPECSSPMPLSGYRLHFAERNLLPTSCELYAFRARDEGRRVEQSAEHPLRLLSWPFIASEIGCDGKFRRGRRSGEIRKLPASVARRARDRSSLFIACSSLLTAHCCDAVAPAAGGSGGGGAARS